MTQFGLACVYLHRTGLSVGDVVLFRKIDDMHDKLPRTHALMKLGIRVNSITRNETLIKRLIRDDIESKKGVDSWIFPDF